MKNARRCGRFIRLWAADLLQRSLAALHEVLFAAFLLFFFLEAFVVEALLDLAFTTEVAGEAVIG